MRWRPRMKRRTEEGASAVEFALVVPLLLVVVFGIINFGFVFAQQISLNNGARQAARFAVVDGPTCAQVEAEGMNSAGTIGMNSPPTPSISRGIPPATPSPAPCPGKPCASSAPGESITVTMTRSATWAVPFPPFTTSNAPTLVGKGVMRCEFK